ncbi:hypothetical protein ACTL6U_05305 [Rhodovibrionaceae bacterium A322]
MQLPPLHQLSLTWTKPEASFKRSRLQAAGLMLALPLALGILTAQSTTAQADSSKSWDCSVYPGPNTADLNAFLNTGCPDKLNWPKDPKPRMIGPVYDDKYYGVHGEDWGQVHYTQEVLDWMKAGRPDDKPLSDGTLIIKKQFGWKPGTTKPGEAAGWTVMYKQQAASYDGWLWGYIGEGTTKWDTLEAFTGYCVACHSVANNKELTFVAQRPLPPDEKEDWTGWKPEAFGTSKLGDAQGVASAHEEAQEDAPSARSLAAAKLQKPRSTPDPAFLDLFPQFAALDPSKVKTFPNQTNDHVPPSPHHSEDFVTSDICSGCHDANNLLANLRPNMMVELEGRNVNLSPYGEWSTSMMGLAGRDPIFHAQLESERRLHPELADVIDNTCSRCHGVMGKRQLEADSDGKELFTHDLFYKTGDSPEGRYGALARDGISCTTCHRIPQQDMAARSAFTGLFQVNDGKAIFGPYDDVAPYAMENGLGMTPKMGDHLNSSELCASCHVIKLPILKTDQKYTAEEFAQTQTGHEQTTYLEWVNSDFNAPDNPEKNQSCQSCHMTGVVTEFAPGSPDKPLKLSFKVANIQDSDYPEFANETDAKDREIKVREDYGRHTLAGANLFGQQLLQQFHEPLGINPDSPNISAYEDALPALELTARATKFQAQERSVRLAITNTETREGNLEVTTRVTSLVGHKLPSGVGFRRAFLTLEVLDKAGKPLWASGASNSLGVILDGQGQPLETEFSLTEWQPHHSVITRQDQVQIYEERHLNSADHLTTSFLALDQEVKDNRLLPKGWRGADSGRLTDEEYRAMKPCQRLSGSKDCQPLDDPAYHPGKGGWDELIYRIPLSEIPGAAKVQLSMNYQAIPPYYLRDRFEIGKGGPETARLHSFASHLTTEGTGIDNWKLRMADVTAPLELGSE